MLKDLLGFTQLYSVSINSQPSSDCCKISSNWTDVSLCHVFKRGTADAKESRCKEKQMINL